MNKLYNFILVLLITTTAFGQAMLTDANLNSKFIEYGKPVGVVSGGGNVSLSGTAAAGSFQFALANCTMRS